MARSANTLTGGSGIIGAPVTLPPGNGRLQGAEIRRLWEEIQPDFQDSRDRILYSRDIQAGREVVPPPDGFEDEDLRDALTMRLPERKLVPLRMTNVLRRKRPILTRNPIGISLQAQKQAEDLQTWTNAVMAQLDDEYDLWGALIGKLVQESECALIVQPDMSFWSAMPSFVDSLDGGAPSRRYWRDAQGNPTSSRRFGQYDHRRTRRAYDDEVTDFLARRLPFLIRVISATDCLPIFGPRRKLEGLLVRTLYSRHALLRRKYRWGQQDADGRFEDGLLIPREAGPWYGNASGSQVYLYEAWLTDEDGLPYVSYSAGGMDTLQYDGQDFVEPSIDLFAEYGISELPCTYSYGQHFESDDPDEKGVPILDPLSSAILGAESMIFSMNVYARKVAFPPWFMPVDEKSPEQVYLEDDGSMREFDLPPAGGIMAVTAPPVPGVAPRASDDARYIIGDLTARFKAASQDPTEGAQSGHQLVLGREYQEVTQDMVLQGALRAWQQAARGVIRMALGLSRGLWTALDGERLDTPVYANVEIPPTNPRSSSGPASQRVVVTFDERWVGQVEDVQAEYPPESSNLAEIQQAMDMADRGYGTFDEVRSMKGDQSPAFTRAKVYADQYYKTPEGISEIAELAAQLRGEQEKADMLALQRTGRVTPGGLPTAAMAPEATTPPQGGPGAQPEQGPMQPGPATMGPPAETPGTTMPDMGGSALGGAVSAGYGTGPALQDAQTRAAIPGGL